MRIVLYTSLYLYLDCQFYHFICIQGLIKSLMILDKRRLQCLESLETLKRHFIPKKENHFEINPVNLVTNLEAKETIIYNSDIKH